MKEDNPNDKVYTQEFIVNEVISEFTPYINKFETILEPFRGGGAFYDKLLPLSDNPVGWCEIDEGIDFFDYNIVHDWIITNPPYSSFDKVLPKCLELAYVAAVWVQKGWDNGITDTYEPRCYEAKRKKF